MTWLLSAAAKARMESYLSGKYKPLATDAKSFEASCQSSIPTFQIEGSTAVIAVEGVLTEQPDFFAWLSGGNTLYEDIVSAINSADASDSIKEIRLNIDSPGGNFKGLYRAMETIRSAKKPIIAYVAQADSAAYGLASQSDKIIANDISSSIGSIGVAMTVLTYDGEKDFASTEAPKKRPDPNTEDGEKIIIEHLDARHNLFVSEIAKGRSQATGKNITSDMINNDYGRGASLLAEAALAAGMIDEIASGTGLDAENKPAASSGNNDQGGTMDIETLKREHPAVYAEAFGAGKEAGEAALKSIAKAHAVYAEASGDYKTALEACAKGEAVSAELEAKYKIAAFKKTFGEQVEDEQPEALSKQTEETKNDAFGKALAAQGIVFDTSTDRGIIQW